MKRHSLAILALTGALAIIPAAIADTVTVGPLTFGSNDPYLGEPSFSSDGPKSGQVFVEGQPTPFADSLGVTSWSQAIAFTFDIAPGWNISSMQFLPSNADISWVGMNDEPPASFDSWGIEFEKEITLCSAYDVCSSTSSNDIRYGGAYLPPVLFNAQAGPGTGVFQSFLYLDNAGYYQDVFPQLLTIDVSLVPEPSSWLLLSTGLGVMLYLFRKKIKPSDTPQLSNTDLLN